MIESFILKNPPERSSSMFGELALMNPPRRRRKGGWRGHKSAHSIARKIGHGYAKGHPIKTAKKIGYGKLAKYRRLRGVRKGRLLRTQEQRNKLSLARRAAYRRRARKLHKHPAYAGKSWMHYPGTQVLINAPRKRRSRKAKAAKRTYRRRARKAAKVVYVARPRRRVRRAKKVVRVYARPRRRARRVTRRVARRVLHNPVSYPKTVVFNKPRKRHIKRNPFRLALANPDFAGTLTSPFGALKASAKSIVSPSFLTQRVLPFTAGFVGTWALSYHGGKFVMGLLKKDFSYTGYTKHLSRLGATVVLGAVTGIVTKRSDWAESVVAGGIALTIVGLLEEYAGKYWNKAVGLGGLSASSNALTSELKSKIAAEIRKATKQVDGMNDYLTVGAGREQLGDYMSTQDFISEAPVVTAEAPVTTDTF
jgi:hypothetical protein